MTENGIVKVAEITKPAEVDRFNPDEILVRPSLFDQIQRAAIMMSRSNLVPPHLRGDDKISDCFLVIEQACRWRLNPFAVAQSTYVLSGKLGYEGKLVAAIVNSSGHLAKRLSYTYFGEGRNRSVQVSGTLKGESEPRLIDGSVEQWATDRNPKWKDMTDQMLSYRGAREWARRHLPEVILGIVSDDELLEIAHSTPQKVVVSQDLDDFVSPEKVSAQDDPPPPVREDPKAPKEAAKPNKKALSPSDKAVSDLFGG